MFFIFLRVFYVLPGQKLAPVGHTGHEHNDEKQHAADDLYVAYGQSQHRKRRVQDRDGGCAHHRRADLRLAAAGDGHTAEHDSDHHIVSNAAAGGLGHGLGLEDHEHRRKSHGQTAHQKRLQHDPVRPNSGLYGTSGISAQQLRTLAEGGVVKKHKRREVKYQQHEHAGDDDAVCRGVKILGEGERRLRPHEDRAEGGKHRSAHDGDDEHGNVHEDGQGAF